jgi:vacuolar-type H+-ATPase subunit E/Vma4
MKAPAPDQAGDGDALGPVRAELLRAAHADADALLARTEREAAAAIDKARAEARTILAEARRQGEADGAAAARDLRMRARHEARSRQLATRRQMYDELRRRATEHVRELRQEGDYDSVLERLRQRARRLLGPDADITEHADGGVVAQAAGRRVDCTLDALAARALDRMGTEVERLWER